MLTYKKFTVIAFLIGTLCISNSASATDVDFPEGKDHPKIPRVAGTTILGFAESSYDEGVFMTAAVGEEIKTTNVEGKHTRIMYVGPKSLSPLGILRNYQQAFQGLGEVEEIYSCTATDCFRNLGEVFVWRESNLMPNNLGSSKGFIFGFGSSDSGRNYWYGKVKTPEALYHISVTSAVMTYSSGGNVIPKIKDHPVIHLEVVEIADFKANLEVVTAQDMTDKINQKGHIALYGIHFDFDSDRLKAESDPTLEQIAKVMTGDSKLNIYVVGHTDNKGTLEYNNELSNRRATAVVKNLTSVHGIASERMIAIGVGPAAPISTNKTDDGRALNRRVELVER
jgi:outer membrane protein OmpA-like peptidoglycan-associated protein